MISTPKSSGSKAATKANERRAAIAIVQGQLTNTSIAYIIRTQGIRALISLILLATADAAQPYCLNFHDKVQDMSPHLSRRAFLSSALATALVGSNAQSADGELGTALSDDYSRGEIFQKFVVAPWVAENKPENHTLAIPSSFKFPADVIYDVG